MIKTKLKPYIIRLVGQDFVDEAKRKPPIRNLLFLQHWIAFAKKYGQLKSQSGVTLLNHELIFAEFIHSGLARTTYSWSHGADSGSYIGSGLLYFAIPYMLKAKTCVCIGSGAGFVPRLMHQAQLEAHVRD